MIKTKTDLKEYLLEDRKSFRFASSSFLMFIVHLISDPISDRWYIWQYLYALRHLEYNVNNHSIINKIMRIYWLMRIRHLSYKTGFQIPANTCGKGLCIWHFGSIIINPKARIGDNCTLYPNVLIGHKYEGGEAPHIGSNVFIGSSAKIIGNLSIGDNCVIAPNSVVVHDINNGITVGGIPARNLNING
jgi:serine O-acetyltransferase